MVLIKNSTGSHSSLFTGEVVAILVLYMVDLKSLCSRTNDTLDMPYLGNRDTNTSAVAQKVK